VTKGGILFVVGQLGYGGLERQLCYLVRGLVARAIVPDVLVWGSSEEDTYSSKLTGIGVRVWRFRSGIGAARKMLRLVEISRSLRPGIIHSYSDFTNVAAKVASLVSGAPALGSVRANHKWENRNSHMVLWSLCSRFPEWQVYNNFQAYFDAQRSGFPLTPKRVFVVRNGVDLEHFAPLPPQRSGRCRALGVGSLYPKKNWGLVVDACEELKLRNVVLDISIVGEGPERGILQKAIDQKRLGEDVRLLGTSDDVRPALAQCSFLVHVSNNEGCPNVIMEAMACGRAVVCTDAGDSRYIVDDGITGFVVPKKDLRALVDRMSRLVADRGLCVRMGEKGRAKAEREFGLDRLVDETLQVYSLAGWRPPRRCAA
jgi:glycosyltransferase involved in cell wall biosynthesis